MPARNPLRIARLLVSLGQLTKNLERLDRVFEINAHLVALRTPAEEAAVVTDFGSTPAGARALRERLRQRFDLKALEALPETTLGGAYALFMKQRGLSADSLPDLETPSDIAYVIAHFYETHDLWHVVTGFDTDPAGELGVQAFLLAQSRAYLPLLLMGSILLNTAVYAYDQREARLDALVRGWTMGRKASNVVGLDWRPCLDRPLAQVRAELGL